MFIEIFTSMLCLCLLILVIYLISYIKKQRTDFSADIISKKIADEERHEIREQFSSLSDMTMRNVSLISKDTKQSVDSLNSSIERMMRSQKLENEANASRQSEGNANLRREIVSQFSELNNISVRTMAEISGINQKNMAELKQSVESRLGEIVENNDNALLLMRQAVENKLTEGISSGLEVSFKSVNSQLEQLYSSIGQMQSLTADVVDLKKILGNVKQRGNWGEMQLGNLIADILAPNQFEKEKMLTKGERARVDYAIKLPDDNGGEVWLPVDSKFPMDKYNAVISASESGNTEAYASAVSALKNSAAESAKSIASKYILPPETTDFAIMFVPSEGLYAMLYDDGFAYSIQSKYRVILSGPSSFSALLSSIHTAFRSFAIRKNSDELYKLLGSVKKSFEIFKNDLDSATKSLITAQSKLEKVSQSTGRISKKLYDIEENQLSESVETE